jgi:hypothetical protein
MNQYSRQSRQVPVVAYTPEEARLQDERATTIMIPILGEEPGIGPVITQSIKTHDKKEDKSSAWLALVLLVFLFVGGAWTLMTGSDSNAAPAAPTLSPKGPAEDSQIANLTIEAFPKEANIQIAAVSLGATLKQNGSLQTQVPTGEKIALTVSLDGYQTVQKSVSAINGVLTINLAPKQEPQAQAETEAPRIAGPQKAPSQAKKQRSLAPAEPSDCLD